MQLQFRLLNERQRGEVVASDKEQRIAATLADPRWAAVLARDRLADGQFVYAVASTGVYCRPTCPARRPSPGNVSFYATPADAAAAGFRPCQRCRPTQPALAIAQATLIADLCRHIESAEYMPTLAELAQRAGLSRYHLHRLFKASTGLTPKAYAAAHRAERVRRELQRSGSVSAAIYAAGYQSTARFYADSPQLLGMTPSAYRAGGADTAIAYAIGRCSLGGVLVAHSARGVCAILLGDTPADLLADLRSRFPAAHLCESDSAFAEQLAQVIACIEKPQQPFPLPVDIRGTAFQQRVWQALRAIPPGLTLSYSQLAERIGAAKAVRAVAGACAANPLAVVIPCHRVVRNDGGLAGYRWGLARKHALLAREAAATIDEEET